MCQSKKYFFHRKFRIKLFYHEPNRLNGTTFNWQSEASQVKLSKFPVRLIKKSDEINGERVTLKDFIKVRKASLLFAYPNYNKFFFRTPKCSTSAMSPPTRISRTGCRMMIASSIASSGPTTRAGHRSSSSSQNRRTMEETESWQCE